MTEDIEYKYKTFRLAVIAMRERQRFYFKTRNGQALRDSKALEERVDKMLQEP